MFDLTSAVGRQLWEPDRSLPLAKPYASVQGTRRRRDDRPVLQLNSLPVTLNPSDYENAFSSSNPRGDYGSLYAFRRFTDPLPRFSRYYSASGKSMEDLYRYFVQSAVARAEDRRLSYTRRVLASARESFDLSGYTDMGGTPGEWRPVSAVPEDWYDTNQCGRFQSIDLDLSRPNSEDCRFRVIGSVKEEPKSMSWQTSSAQGRVTSVALDANSMLQSLRFKCLAVTLNRPWLKPEILELKGLYLPGERKGSVSAGRMTRNMGMMPLLPTALIVGIDSEITAEWSGADRSHISNALDNDAFLSLGPFVLNAGMSQGSGRKSRRAVFQKDTIYSQVLHVVGWLSSLVPLFPQSDDPGLPPNGVPVKMLGSPDL